MVGIFPDDRALIRLAGMLCIELNDEWLVGRGYLSAESIALVLAAPGEDTDTEIKEEGPELQAAWAADILTDDRGNGLHDLPGLGCAPARYPPSDLSETAENRAKSPTPVAGLGSRMSRRYRRAPSPASGPRAGRQPDQCDRCRKGR